MRESALPVLLVVVALVAVGTGAAMLTVDRNDTETASATADVPATDSSVDRTITVAGSGSASATPDEAVVTVAVVADGDVTQAIRRELANESSDLRTALNYASVGGDQISTVDYRITEPHRREEAGDAPTYRGVHAFEIRLDQTNATGGAVDAATDSGAEVTGVRFTLSEESRTALRDEALQNAMADASQQADTLAAAGDLQTTGVASIDASDRRYSPVRYETAMADAAAGSSTTIETGDVSVSVDVRVVYNATDA